VVTCAGAAVLLLVANRGRVIPIRKVLAGAPWQIVAKPVPTVATHGPCPPSQTRPLASSSVRPAFRRP
jgi:hypothetical protein